ncbi:hypothetical protein LMG29739_05684 [Paraburkholderia solisilvae]|uniref:Uncharacterized protein n=1 Tax=Paraburkholderia solisilvae TaxID=624376 RepID=A0A6J5ETV6_9BURK|nr:hypothetical protein LMG29739_05684 [Paraburkholderia solisilvae]
MHWRNFVETRYYNVVIPKTREGLSKQFQRAPLDSLTAAYAIAVGEPQPFGGVRTIMQTGIDRPSKAPTAAAEARHILLSVKQAVSVPQVSKVYR